MDCMIVCCSVGFLILELKNWVEMLRCASAVVIVSTISLRTKCNGVCISCCVRFLVPFKLSLFLDIEFQL